VAIFTASMTPTIANRISPLVSEPTHIDCE
jgi:hypothetical protein